MTQIAVVLLEQQFSWELDVSLPNAGRPGAPSQALEGCALLGSYLWGGFIKVTDCFHSSQFPVPVLAYKHRR